MNLAIVVLAAGHGSRMKSKTQKILHQVGGKPMVAHVVEAAEAVTELPPVLVIAPGEEGVPALFGPRASYAYQAERLGTGHATGMAAPLLRDLAEQVLVTYADMPLLRAETMGRLARARQESGAALAMLTVQGEPSSSFGRVVRDEHGQVRGIVEVAQARRQEDGEAILAIRELNVGVYCFEAGFLWANLPQLPLRQARTGPEYYLTDMVERAVAQGRAVVALPLEDPDEGLGAGTRAELAQVEKAFQRRVNRHWLEQGVTLVDPDTIYIDSTVQIGQDTVIWPHTFLQGNTVIGCDCQIGPLAVLRDARLGDGQRVEPFTYLRGQEPA